ncbi:G-protein coupled receptor 183-like [Megalops cyprinoides]|uniref:G-protein coupled receptor 183-like n=1 Tax=Megalops cyprinoides TaxID=118141 RepID=UPI0018649536|nr:G-protein coupled receptor 183-like [Megalops cyprinoides]
MLTLNTTVPLAFDFNRPEDYFIFLFHILFATSAVFLAGSVVIGILSTRGLRIQNRFIFMLNTSISDTLTGFSVYYLGLFDVQEGYPSRNGTFYILPSFLGVNILTFLFAQIDRYIAVCHPFFYSRYIMRPVVIGICVFCWFYTYSILTVQNLVPISKAAQINAFGVMTLQIIVLTKVLMTIKLYVIARYQLARDPPSTEKENKKESLRIIVFVVICFLTLWCPSFVNIIVKQLTLHGLKFRNEATNLFATMARFNALSTPAVYIWGSPALREAVKQTVWRRMCPRAQQNRAVNDLAVNPKLGPDREAELLLMGLFITDAQSQVCWTSANHRVLSMVLICL